MLLYDVVVNLLARMLIFPKPDDGGSVCESRHSRSIPSRDMVMLVRVSVILVPYFLRTSVNKVNPVISFVFISPTGNISIKSDILAPQGVPSHLDYH